MAVLYLKINSKEVRVGRLELAKLGVAADKVSKKTKDMGRKMDVTASQMSSSFKVVGRDISRYITLPFLAASGAALKFSADLTKGLGNVETLIAGTGSRIYELQDIVTGLSNDTGVSFDNMTRGLYETISAFQDGADTAGRFEAAVRSSVAGNATVLDSVKLISAVTKAYGDTSEEAAQKVTDLAFSAVKYGQTTFSELANAIQSVTANSERLGVTQEELFSIYATLTGVTGNASEVTTQFNRALLSLSNPTDTLRGVFAQYNTEQGKTVTTGKEFIQVAGGTVNAFKIITDAAEKSGKPIEQYITRQTGVIAVTALTGKQFDAYNKKASLVADSTGEMMKAYYAATTGINEFQFILKQVKQTLASVGAEIGTILLPVIVTIARQIADAAERFSALDDNTQAFIIKAIALAAALGPVLIALGSAIKFVKLLGQAMAVLAANPVILIAIAAALALAGTAMYKWYQKTKLQVEALKGLKAASIGIQDATTQFKQFLIETNSVTDAGERNQIIIEKLTKVYGEDFTKALGDSEKSLENVYKAMLKIEAVKFGDELQKGQGAQLDLLNKKYQKTSDKMKNHIAEMVDYSKLIHDQFGTQILSSTDLINMNDMFNLDPNEFDREIAKMGLTGLRDDFIQLFSLTDLQGDARAEIKNFLDDLEEQVDLRSDGVFRSLSIITEGIGGTFTIKVNDVSAPLDALKKEVEEATGGGTGEEKAKRLKTWQDYFVAITGIQGEAFAKIEEGGFGSLGADGGARAASAYATAFTKELESKKLMKKLFGEVFSIDDSLDVAESQLEKGLSNMEDLLNLSVNEIRGMETGAYNLEDALGKLDTEQLEKLYSVFELIDPSIIGVQNEIIRLQRDVNDFTFLKIQKDSANAFARITADVKNMQGIMGEESNVGELELSQTLADIESYQDQIDALTAKYGAMVTVIPYVVEDMKALTDAQDESRQLAIEQSQTFDRLTGALGEFGNIGSSMIKLARGEMEKMTGAEIDAAGGMMFLEGTINSVVDSIGDLAYGLGQAVAGIGDANDAWGDFGMTLAKQMSQLAITAGLMMIVASGGTNLIGWGLVVAGLAGQFAIGYAEGVVQKEKEDRADANANALGGVYDNGIKMYKKGGVLSDFSNSIVSTPTLFNNGGSMMGEAGPEAIIPLTRSSNGELGVNATGVSGGGGKTTVIVNNYGKDSATVSESTDASGNTDIMVTIGQAVNGMISKGKMDGSMKGRYGLQPRGLN